MGKRSAARALVAVALVLAVAGMYRWGQATEEAERDARADTYVNAALDGPGYETVEPDPDRTVPIALFVLGGLSVVCGAILWAGNDGD